MDRERLMEIIDSNGRFNLPTVELELLADHLIANGIGDTTEWKHRADVAEEALEEAYEEIKKLQDFKTEVSTILGTTKKPMLEEIRELKHRAELDTITFPLELQCGDLTNYIGYWQAETEKLVAISFGKLTEKGKYAGENMTKDKTSVPLFIAYFDRIESLEVLENLINIAKARLKELEVSNAKN